MSVLRRVNENVSLLLCKLRVSVIGSWRTSLKSVFECHALSGHLHSLPAVSLWQVLMGSPHFAVGSGSEKSASSTVRAVTDLQAPDTHP